MIIYDGSQYYRANDLAKALGYSNFRKDILQNVPREHIVLWGGHWDTIRTLMMQPPSSSRGMEWRNLSTPQEFQVVSILLKLWEFPFQQNSNNFITRWQQSKTIMDAFQGKTMMRQYSLSGYRVDLFFPEHK